MDHKLTVMHERNLFEAVLIMMGRNDLRTRIKEAARSEEPVSPEVLSEWIQGK